MIIPNTRNVARVGYAAFYGISVGKLERLRLQDTGGDGKKIKRIIKKWRDEYRL